MMYDRMKSFLERCLSAVVVIVVLLLAVIYLLLNGVLITNVVNELMLGTYISTMTGFRIATLIWSLGWVPYAFLSSGENKK
jgi:hypothetical protein